jgi:4-amino-4-deoxy-L-arabinose transferase-like glycosyltransferase
MVELAILLGVFSNLIFGLGLMGELDKLPGVGILFGASLIFLLIKKNFWLKTKNLLKKVFNDPLSLLLLGLLAIQAAVNLIGALGPELGFDALWYHLTIPKIYLQHGNIFFIPGNLFYYSAMPKLVEMFYLLALSFSKYGILAKTIHWSFGILSAIALFRLAKRYLKLPWALLATTLFYTTLIVGWESITAYIDLGRTFFEILALDLFLVWTKDKKTINLIESAIMLGLAISTKLIAFASLPVFLILVFLKGKSIKDVGYFLLFCLLVPLPWFVFSWVSTGNPVYPIFSGILDASHNFPHPLLFIKDLFGLLYRPQDPISPVFLIFLPFIFFTTEVKHLKSYVLLSLAFWLLTPRTGGSRFILPYLPAWAFLLTTQLSEQKAFLKRAFLALVIVSAAINIGYRALANKKFIPVVLGRQTKEQFLAERLNYDFGDFWDMGEEIKKRVGDSPVLFYGGHNLFYADFPFVHYTYAQPQTLFSYILSQDARLPENLSKAKLIYYNAKSKTSLYLFNSQYRQ